jgi:hypothetical protein
MAFRKISPYPSLEKRGAVMLKSMTLSIKFYIIQVLSHILVSTFFA